MTKDINIYGSLEDMGKGKHTVSLQVELPEGVTLKSMVPEKVEIELVPVYRGDVNGYTD